MPSFKNILNTYTYRFICPGRAILLFILFFVVFLMPVTTVAQWNNNPQANKILATGIKNPLNITTVPDQNGGGFIFWEDKVDSLTNNIYFQHFTDDGSLDFRADGKPVSSRMSNKAASIPAGSTAASAVVVYKDFGNDKLGELYAQRVSNRGDLLWSENGLKLTDHQGESLDPSVASDSRGNVYLSYIYRDYSTPANYIVYVQIIKPSGEVSFKQNGLVLVQSQKIKSHPRITADNKGGAFIIWTESSDGKARLFMQHIDAAGRTNWGSRAISISSANENVLGYSIHTVANNFAYIDWELKRTGKDIYHQLISIDGKPLWAKDGERLTNQYGNQNNPQIIYSDSTIIVSWINEVLGDKDIYIQKFNMRGRPLWTKDGVAVIRLKGNQISQRMLADNKSGAIIAWIDMRVKAQKGTIFAQRLSREGNLLWDTTGIELAANINSNKSYLSLLPNKINGAVAVFKETRDKESNIYGQRILGNGRFNFDILGFRAIVENSTVRATWQTYNESENKGFYVERILSDTIWKQARFIPGKNSKGLNSYEFSEELPAKGVPVFYRLTQIDNDGNTQQSNIVKLDNFNLNTNNFFLAQNFPNPFADSTEIKYYLPERCKVTLDIYNDRIETVTTPVDAVQDKGEYTVPFFASAKGARLKNGVYFYRLKAGDFVEVKRMVIAK